MNEQELKKSWITKEQKKEASIDLWDAMASNFKDFELPSQENSFFLRLLGKEKILEGCNTVLDIGCGAGKYSISLADLCERVTGIDISPKMIEFAKENAERYQKTSIEFLCESWEDLDLRKTGMYKAYDFVFAHMTPAVGTLKSFEKMLEAARKYCVLVKPSRRRDKISGGIDELMGINKKEKDSEALYPFEYLWLKGYEPRIEYEKQVWNIERPLEEAYPIYMNRVKTIKSITVEEEGKIKKYLNEHAENGIIYDKTETTILSIYWKL